MNSAKASVNNLSSHLTKFEEENNKLYSSKIYTAINYDDIPLENSKNCLKNIIYIDDIEALERISKIENGIKYLFKYPKLDIGNIIARQTRLMLLNGVLYQYDQKTFPLCKKKDIILSLYRNIIMKHQGKNNLTRAKSLLLHIDKENKFMSEIAEKIGLHLDLNIFLSELIFNKQSKNYILEIADEIDIETLEFICRVLSELDKTRHITLSNKDFELVIITLMGRMLSYRQDFRCKGYKIDNIFKDEKVLDYKKKLGELQKEIFLILLFTKLNDTDLKDVILNTMKFIVSNR